MPQLENIVTCVSAPCSHVVLDTRYNPSHSLERIGIFTFLQMFLKKKKKIIGSPVDILSRL